MAAFPLFRLPRELRHQIFDWVIRIPDPPTSIQSLRGPDWQTYHDDIDPDSVTERVFFSSEPVRNPALPLLLTSRQVYVETKAILPSERPASQLGGTKCAPEDPWAKNFLANMSYTHVLDVVFRSDATFWVRWTHVPSKASVLGHLLIRIRALEAEPDDGSTFPLLPDAVKQFKGSDIRILGTKVRPPFRDTFKTPKVFHLFHFLLATIVRTGFSTNLMPRDDWDTSIWARHLTIDFPVERASRSMQVCHTLEESANLPFKYLRTERIKDCISLVRIIYSKRQPLTDSERLGWYVHQWLLCLSKGSNFTEFAHAGLFIRCFGTIDVYLGNDPAVLQVDMLPGLRAFEDRIFADLPDDMPPSWEHSEWRRVLSDFAFNVLPRRTRLGWATHFRAGDGRLKKMCGRDHGN
jgi:hypothetical protein